MVSSTSQFQFSASPYIEQIDATVEAEPGSIEVSWDIRAATIDELFAGGEAVQGGGVIGGIQRGFLNLGESVGEAQARLSGQDSFDIDVSITPARLGRIQSQLTGRRGAISAVAGEAGIQAQILANQAQNLGGGFNITSFNTTTTVPVGGEAGGSQSWSFRPIRVPVPEGTSVIDELDRRNLPELRITFNVPRIVRPIRGGQETFNLTIPPEAFIEEVSLDADCSELFSEQFSRIEEIRTDASSALSGAESTVSNMESIANELATEAGASTGGGVSSIASTVSGFSQRDIVGLGTGRLQRLRTRVEGFDPRTDVADRLEDEVNDLRDEIQENISQRCRPDLLGELGDVEGTVDDLVDVSSDADELRSSLLDALEGIESIDCANVFSSIDDDVSELEARLAVAGGTPAFQLPLSANNFNSVQSTISGIQDDIDSEIPDDSPCADQFRSRLERTRSRLTELRQAAPPEDILGCTDVDDSILSAISDFEEDVSSFTATRSGDRAELLETADALRERVEDEVQDNNPCKQELFTRIRSAAETASQIELGCADIPRRLRNPVSSVVGAVAQFESRDQLARLPERKEELQQELDEVIDSVERNVDSNNPCKSELLARARDARSRLLQTPVRPETAVPCDQRFEAVGNEINSFEDMVLNVSPPVRPDDLQEIVNQGQQIIEMVEQDVPQDDPCSAEMTERVRQLTQRVESLTARVRVETEVGDGEAQRREELIEQLLGSIDRVQATSEEAREAVEEAEQVT